MSKQTKEAIKPIQGELETLGNDTKEIYDMIAGLQKLSAGNESFQKLSVENSY